MERRKNRMSVGGLRRSEPTTLAVLTQDVLRLPVTQIEPGTLLDLLALSEATDQLSSALGKELLGFQDRIKREILDLPDGEALAEFTRELAEQGAERAPACHTEVTRTGHDARKKRPRHAEKIDHSIVPRSLTEVVEERSRRVCRIRDV